MKPHQEERTASHIQQKTWTEKQALKKILTLMFNKQNSTSLESKLYKSFLTAVCQYMNQHLSTHSTNLLLVIWLLIAAFRSISWQTNYFKLQWFIADA